MNFKTLVGAVITAFALTCASTSHAQIVSEDFTGTSTNAQWFFFNGACLTAGTSTSTTSRPKTPTRVELRNLASPPLLRRSRRPHFCLFCARR